MPKTTISRRLRRNATEAEKLIWSALRDRQLGGAKFRRQHAIGPYIVDFFCFEDGLVIELDGGQHAWQSVGDAARDRWLEAQGYRVLRFWNNDVMANRNGVLQHIQTVLENLEAES